MCARDPLITHISNMPGHELRILFKCLSDIEDAIEWDYELERAIFETFLGHLWRATEGEDMLDEGRKRKE